MMRLLVAMMVLATSSSFVLRPLVRAPHSNKQVLPRTKTEALTPDVALLLAEDAVKCESTNGFVSHCNANALTGH